NFFKEGDAQERVLEGLRRVTGLSSGGKAKVTTPAATASSVPATAEPAVSAAPAPAAPAAPPATPAVAASTLPAATSLSATKDAPTSSSPATPAEAPASSNTPANASGKEAEPSELPDTADEEEGSKGLKPNSARGYDHGHYSWGQTLTELLKLLLLLMAYRSSGRLLSGPCVPDEGALWQLGAQAARRELRDEVQQQRGGQSARWQVGRVGEQQAGHGVSHRGLKLAASDPDYVHILSTYTYSHARTQNGPSVEEHLPVRPLPCLPLPVQLSVSVPVPKGTKAKMLDVVITRTKLKVAVKGQPAILEGELSEAVKAEDCMWNIEGSVVELTLTKQDGMHWWSAVLKGEPVIDVHKVEPENSKLGDLDAETRQTVEKMMFDQRQKAMGRPTSDEMKKDEMLKKFMAAHPEMDFSKAKMIARPDWLKVGVKPIVKVDRLVAIRVLFCCRSGRDTAMHPATLCRQK
ncbi:nuclear movement family protein, partial [Haematococcus lacustris]